MADLAQAAVGCGCCCDAASCCCSCTGFVDAAIFSRSSTADFSTILSLTPWMWSTPSRKYVLPNRFFMFSSSATSPSSFTLIDDTCQLLSSITTSSTLPMVVPPFSDDLLAIQIFREQIDLTLLLEKSRY